MTLINTNDIAEKGFTIIIAIAMAAVISAASLVL